MLRVVEAEIGAPGRRQQYARHGFAACVDANPLALRLSRRQPFLDIVEAP
jgi:hypothetical protein